MNWVKVNIRSSHCEGFRKTVVLETFSNLQENIFDKALSEVVDFDIVNFFKKGTASQMSFSDFWKVFWNSHSGYL